MSEAQGPNAGAFSSARFKSAYASAPPGLRDWVSAAASCVAALGDLPEGTNLGFLYVTDDFAEDLPAILDFLRTQTTIGDWVGCVGMGVAANGLEFHAQPAISVLVGAMGADGYRLFDTVADSLQGFRDRHGEWIGRRHPLVTVTHGDPRNQNIMEMIEGLSEASSSYLVGGLASSRGAMPQVSGQVTDGGLSGVLLASDQAVVAGLTQGCSPIGPRRSITECDETVIMSLDGRPALDVLKEDIGELLSRNLQGIGGTIFVAFPVTGSDTGDYLVRNLIGIDLDRGWIQVGAYVSPGDSLTFCRRDAAAAREDLSRMLADVKGRCDRAPQAALYFSCLARGQNLFGPNSEELEQIQDVLGDVPLAGFFANGEICNNRLYGYTGVMALLL